MHFQIFNRLHLSHQYLQTMKIVIKIILWTLGILLLAVVGLAVYVNFTWKKTYDAPYPDVKAVNDSAVLARGRYLVFGPAHCAHCHAPMESIEKVESGELVALSGGFGIELGPMGKFYAPNITPDPETGIGSYTDGEIARALRHSVNKNGNMMFPFMPFQNISEDDMVAIISFLRSQPPVRHEMPKSEVGAVTKALIAFGMMKPEGPKGTPPQSVTPELTPEYGKYVANYIANCNTCHTSFDMMTGQPNGPEFGGGFYFEPDNFSKGYSFVSPNLTSHEGTGLIASWSEDRFVERFRQGRVHAGSPMPWGVFKNMDEVDIRAVYRYLRTIPPADNKIDKIVFEPGEKPEKKKS